MAARIALLGSLAHQAGNVAVFIAPGLLAWATLHGQPFLTSAVAFLVFPLLRPLFGVVGESEPPLPEWVAKTLDWLPVSYGLLLSGVLALLLMTQNWAVMPWSAVLGWTLSMWATMGLATCVAHELLHRQQRSHRVVGHLIAGMAGYPMLGYEHARHHRRPGSTAAAEWPKLDESAGSFVRRRLRMVLRETFGLRGLAIAGDHGSPTVRGLRLGTAATVASWTAFSIAGGWRGATVYGAAALLVVLSLQLITYIQHWGLGDDSVEDARTGDHGWDSDCRFQAWVTMGLSLHQAHHRSSSRPYYRLRLCSDSPRPPAGYTLLMVAALIPPVWRRVMAPPLAHWRAQPERPLSAGRRLVCVTYYR